MGKIDELIKQFCPDGVKKVPLGDVLDYEQPSKYIVKSTEYDNSYNIPVLTAGKGFLLGYTNEQTGVYSASEENPTIIFDDFVTSFHWVDFPFKVKSSAMKMLTCKDKVNSFRFIYYAMCEIGFVAKEHSRHWISVYSKIEIPLPPLAVQKKIVEILDTFTGMIDNLQKELEQRQKQFEHYRDQMLTFKEGEVQMKSIKEIGKLVRGNGLQKKDFTEDGTGCIHYGQIYTRFGLSTSSTLTFVDSQLAAKLTKVSPGDLVIACTSENIEDVCKSVAWLGKEDIVTGGHACVFKHSENPKYIAYCFTTSAFFLQKRKYAYGAKVIDIKTEKLGEITLPVPSLEKQQEIVDKLDTFEALISNIKQEIELRQKQYEFYREKLLTFE